MSNTPTLTLEFCHTLSELIAEFRRVTGYSDAAIADRAGIHRESIRSIRMWDGARRSPTLKTTAPLEAFMRRNFSEDPDESERMYREACENARALVASRYATS